MYEESHTSVNAYRMFIKLAVLQCGLTNEHSAWITQQAATCSVLKLTLSYCLTGFGPVLLAFSGSVAVQPDVAVIYVMVPEFQSLSTDELIDV